VIFEFIDIFLQNVTIYRNHFTVIETIPSVINPAEFSTGIKYSVTSVIYNAVITCVRAMCTINIILGYTN